MKKKEKRLRQRIINKRINNKGEGFMKNSKKKKKKLLMWGIVAVLFGSIFVRQQIIINRLNKEYKQNQATLSKLKATNEQLNEQIKLTERDDYMEKLARENLMLVKPGEILIIDKNKKK